MAGEVADLTDLMDWAEAATVTADPEAPKRMAAAAATKDAGMRAFVPGDPHANFIQCATDGLKNILYVPDYSVDIPDGMPDLSDCPIRLAVHRHRGFLHLVGDDLMRTDVLNIIEKYIPQLRTNASKRKSRIEYYTKGNIEIAYEDIHLTALRLGFLWHCIKAQFGQKMRLAAAADISEPWVDVLTVGTIPPKRIHWDDQRNPYIDDVGHIYFKCVLITDWHAASIVNYLRSQNFDPEQRLYPWAFSLTGRKEEWESEHGKWREHGEWFSCSITGAEPPTGKPSDIRHRQYYTGTAEAARGDKEWLKPLAGLLSHGSKESTVYVAWDSHARVVHVNRRPGQLVVTFVDPWMKEQAKGTSEIYDNIKAHILDAGFEVAWINADHQGREGSCGLQSLMRILMICMMGFERGSTSVVSATDPETSFYPILASRLFQMFNDAAVALRRKDFPWAAEHGLL